MKPKKAITDIIEWLINVDTSCSCELGETKNGQQYHVPECVKVSSAHVKRLLKECGFEICWRCSGMGSIEKDNAIEECPACNGQTWIRVT